MDWQNKASNDPDTVATWWEKWPAANIGVQFGQASGIIDLECDSPEAEADLLKLFDGNPPVCPTFTANRGKHRLFKWTERLPHKAAFNYGALEVRTGNDAKEAQSVFPPSRHASGKTYTWTVSPEEVEPPALPETVLVKLWNLTGESKPEEPTERPKSPRMALYEAEAIPEGSRDTTLYAEACALWRVQERLQGPDCFDSPQSQEIVFKRVWAWNRAMCVPPLDDETVLAKCESARSFIRANPGTVQPASVPRSPATGRAVGWGLVIVDSEPPSYELSSPHWGGHITLNSAQMLSFDAIRRAALEQKQVWLPQGLKKVWAGDGKTAALGGELVATASHREAPREVKRTEVIRDMVLDFMAGSWRILREDEKPVPQCLPAKDASGGVHFLFNALLEELARGHDKVSRAELSAVLRDMGAEDKSVGRGAAKRTAKYLPARAIRSE